MVVVLATNTIISAVITGTLSSTSNLILGLVSTGAYSGSFDTAINTFELPSLSAPNIFNIAPQFGYAVGASFETDSPMNIQAGAALTLTKISCIS